MINRNRNYIVLLGVVVTAAWGGHARGATPAAKSGETQTLLTEKHYWRKHYTFFPPRVSVASAKGAGIDTDPAARMQYLARFHHSGLQTPPPPAGWTRPDFDDSGWQIARGRQFVVGDRRLIKRSSPDTTNIVLRGNDPFVEEVGLVCQRGTFRVADPAAVGRLTLTVACRGGIVVYLNGKEVGRRFLPDGKIAPTTVADDYPLEAFFEKQSIAGKKYIHLDPRRHKDSKQWYLRERTFGPRDLPSALLRKGVNVLAVELHRADYPAQIRRKVNRRHPRSLGWATVGMALMSLTAEARAGAVEPMTPPASGLRVWTRDIARPVGRDEVPAPGEELAPIHIVATRNGQFAGQVIVRNDVPLDGIAVEASALSSTAGRGRIGREAITIRYGAVNPTQMGAALDYRLAVLPPGAAVGVSPREPKNALRGRFDALLDSPPVGVTSMPIWLTVRVPPNAPAGDYAGTLTVTVKGAEPVVVPVRLSVAGWTLPDVADYGSLINIYQSPDTLARYYKLQPWSERHWAMIERSLKLMGRAGNIGLFFPLLSESALGNPESMVVWRQEPDRSYAYDFSVFDRYLSTALKYHTRLKFLALNVWGRECAGRRGQPPTKATVTELDAATGKKTNMTLPACGTPECEKLWRPLLTAIQRRLAERKLDHLIRLGLPADGAPHWSHVAMFRRILPGAAWVRESHFNTHSYRYDPADKSAVVPVAYNSIVWGGGVPDPATKRLYGWRHNPGHLIMTFNRPGATALTLKGFPPPWSYRMWMASTLAGGRNGNGRVGGDYWHVGASFVGAAAGGRVSSSTHGGSSGTLFGIYLKSAVGQVGLGNSTTDLFAPGPGGPVTTVRFENAIEGNQEAEARVFIEKALLDKDSLLPETLARRCRTMLDERTNILRMQPIGAGHIARLNWRHRSKLLYDAAADVAKALQK